MVAKENQKVCVVTYSTMVHAVADCTNFCTIRRSASPEAWRFSQFFFVNSSFSMKINRCLFTYSVYTSNPRAAGWSRPRGAPRTRWSDVLGNDLKQLETTLMEASNIALDRSRWRATIVARAVSLPSWQEP